MSASGKSGNVIAKYLPVYFVLLAIAAIEFFLAYQNFSKAGLVRILLVGRETCWHRSTGSKCF